jgi:hypothetical protein
MCPACMASAAMVVAGVISTGGISALAAKLLGARAERRVERDHAESESTKRQEKEK